MQGDAMPFVHREGARLYWRIDGHPDRPPLVLLNSLGTDHSLWEPLMPGLLENFRVLRTDKPGHGASDARDGEYSIAQLGHDVLAVMDAAGVRRAHLCGVSIGAMIGIWVAAHAPERIDRLVLSNTSAKLAPEGFVERIRLIRAGGIAAIADTVLGRFFTPDFVARADARYHSVRTTLLQVDPIGYTGCCAALRDMDLRPLLPRIAAPTLVVTCRDDPSTPAAMGEAIAAAIPRARHVQWELAHIPFVEAPQQYVDLLAGFLADATAARP